MLDLIVYMLCPGARIDEDAALPFLSIPIITKIKQHACKITLLPSNPGKTSTCGACETVCTAETTLNGRIQEEVLGGRQIVSFSCLISGPHSFIGKVLGSVKRSVSRSSPSLRQQSVFHNVQSLRARIRNNNASEREITGKGVSQMEIDAMGTRQWWLLLFYLIRNRICSNVMKR